MVGSTTERADMPMRRDELPATLKRSSKQAQETFIKAHDRAVDSYGDGERAHRTAYSALKHSFEKVGDRWQEKDKKGPSDERAKSGGPNAKGETAGGVDVEGHAKDELLARARKLDVRGRSTMTKTQLAQAIARKQG